MVMLFSAQIVFSVSTDLNAVAIELNDIDNEAEEEKDDKKEEEKMSEGSRNTHIQNSSTLQSIITQHQNLGFQNHHPEVRI